MTPGVYNIDIKQGATLLLPWNWNNTVLTGYSARLVVGYADSSATAVLECSTANGRIVLGGTPSNIVITANKTVMAAIAPGNYVYDLELTSGAGVDYALMTGRFVVQASKAGV